MQEENMKVTRLKEAFRVLQSKGACGSQYDTATVLGYTPSSFSQILNGRVPISDKFLKKLKTLDQQLEQELNIDYIKKGEGEVMIPRQDHSKITKEININTGGTAFIHSHDINASGTSDETIKALEMQNSFLKKIIEEKENTIAEKERLIGILLDSKGIQQ